MSAVTVRLDTKSLENFFDQIEEDVNDAVRPVAQVGAQVLYDEVKKNVASMTKVVTGNLDKAIYQAFKDKQSLTPGTANYTVSWNKQKAPHGQLIEFGHIARYMARTDKNGNWFTMVRPEKRGTPKPKRNAPQSEKDAYYVLRKGGPKQLTAKPFLRNAASKFPAALDAMEEELMKRINRK